MGLSALTTAAGAGVDLGTVRMIEGLWMTGGDPNHPDAHARQEKAFEFYAESGLNSDLERYHPAPKPLDNIRVHTRRPTRKGTIERWTWESGFRTLDRAVQDEWDAYEANRTCHVELWRHRGEPRPTIIFVHSWATGFFHLQREVYRQRSFYSSGLNVATFILPFHGARTPTQAWFGGQLFPSTQAHHANEAFAQAIWDLRGLVQHFKRRGSSHVGVMGQSIGGYTVAMLAAVEDQLDFCIPMIPVSSLAEMMWQLGEGRPSRTAAEARGVTKERIAALYRGHTPIAHPPKLPKNRLMIVAGKGDRVCRPDQVELLWNHWQQPHIHWFAGGHMLHFGWRGVYKDVRRFVGEAIAS